MAPLPSPNFGDALLRPRSIALVGVSENIAAPAGRPLQLLRKSCYSGRIYPIRAGYRQVQGERCWATLAELPETPDDAYLLGAADTVLEQSTQCVALSVPAVSTFASGFAEAWEEGQRSNSKRSTSFAAARHACSAQAVSAWRTSGTAFS